ncbi:hypothetical protein [Kitasatospora sp. NPDC058218]|uniref:hypothetical protein n=1 Tax=Kitasatospora sp. NPDC058218 TaxID=3346385 RepID=UPI0036DB8853
MSAVAEALYPLHELATDLAAKDIENGATQSNDFESFGAILFNLLEAHQHQHRVQGHSATSDAHGDAGLHLAQQEAQDTVALAELIRDFNEVTRLRLRMIATGSRDPGREAETLGKAAAAVNDLTRDILFDLGLAVSRGADGGGGSFPSGEVLRNARSALASLLDRSNALAATVSSIEGWRNTLVVAHRALTTPNRPPYDTTEPVRAWIADNQGKPNILLTRGRIAAGVGIHSWEVGRALARLDVTYSPTTGWTTG